MNKRSTGVLVYSVLFILVGLFVCLPLIQSFVLYSFNEEQLKQYYIKQSNVSSANANIPEKYKPENIANIAYQLQQELKAQISLTFSYITLFIYLCFMIVGMGLLKLKSWACRLTPFLSITGVVQAVLGGYIYFVKMAPIMKKYYEDTPLGQFIFHFSAVIAAVSFVGYIVVFISSTYYFTRPKVRQQFN